ncbi:MAG: hypothetical protein QE484_07040 [Rhizobium sp.]|nr:hypothetical protein [Rhizobium sp.]
MCEAETKQGASGSARHFLVLVAVLLAVVVFDRLDGISFFGDIDDELRLIQIRHLLEVGGWYDLRLPMIQLPEVYQSPWSRLVDLPYVVIASALRPLLGLDGALQVATLVWPPVLLAGLALLAVRFVREITPGERLSRASFVLVGLLLILAAWEFSPGRIDHHNMQMLLMLLIMLGLVTKGGRGGWLVGTGATLSLIIGLECLPFVAVALALVAIGFILNAERSRQMLADTGLAMGLAALLAGLLFVGPEGLTETACDAFSAPFLSALCGYAACFWLLARFISDDTRWLSRLTVLALGGCAVTLALALLYPGCLSGPYHMIDPVSKTYWFDRIQQEQTILAFRQEGATGIAMLAFLSVTSVIAIFACPLWRRETRQSFRHWAAFLFATSALLMTYGLIRYIRFPVALLPLYLPLTLAVWSDLASNKAGRFVSLLCVMAFPVLIGSLYLAVPARTAQQDAVWLMSGDDCRDDDYAELRALAPGRILAPTGLGLALARNVPVGVSVGAIPFHRAAPGIRASFTVFAMDDKVQRQAALAPFNYVAVCHVPFEISAQDAPLYSALANNRGWPGLVPLPVQGEGRLRLFRIDHERLM